MEAPNNTGFKTEPGNLCGLLPQASDPMSFCKAGLRLASGPVPQWAVLYHRHGTGHIAALPAPGEGEATQGPLFKLPFLT